MASKVSDSRLLRLGRIASLSGKVSGNLLARAAGKLVGRDGAWAERKTAKQIVATLGQMKGLAQKVGQAMSMDLDHLPAEMREILSSLQSKSQPMDYRTIARVVQEQLGGQLRKGPDELFATFQKTPLAAASLGQVHRATLKDGRAVAVKVQYPGAASALQADLKNIDALLTAVGGVMGKATSSFKGHGYFDEIATELTRETDYLREARNCERFAALLKPFPELTAPRVISELCAPQVLTLELLEGEPLSALLKGGAAAPNERRFRVSAALIAALFGPSLSEGLVHADPHPGNFLVLPDGRLAVLDYGAVKQLPPHLVEANRVSYRSLLDGEPPDFERLLASARFEVGDATWSDLRPVLREFFDVLRVPVAGEEFDYGTSTLRAEFETVARRNITTWVKVRPPADALMYFRALGGQAQNLRALAAKGPFRSVYADVFARATGSQPTSSAA